MRNNFSIFLFCFSLIINYSAESKTRIVLTTALTSAHYEFRKQQYIRAFETLQSFGYSDFYIVEALAKEGPTFLDDYSKNVFYATVNDPCCKNQGVNESRTLLEALHVFNFDPDDMIIKLTGRHCLTSDYFLRVASLSNVDAVISYCKGRLPAFADGMVPAFCFAMKYKHLCQMYKEIDYELMQLHDVPIEWVIPYFISQKKNEHDFKILVLEKLGISVNAFASSASPGLPENIMLF